MAMNNISSAYFVLKVGYDQAFSKIDQSKWNNYNIVRGHFASDEEAKQILVQVFFLSLTSSLVSSKLVDMSRPPNIHQKNKGVGLDDLKLSIYSKIL